MKIIHNKKNIYFVQTGFGFGNALYLPYAVGCLAVYAEQSKYLSKVYNFRNFIFEREDIQEVIKKMDKPFMVAFSNSVWNFEYNKELAKAVKKAYPDCYIVFGGHNVGDNTNILSKNSVVDFLIYSEGEVPFTALLEYLSGIGEIYDVPSIAYRDGTQIFRTPVLVGHSLEEYPSPYLCGAFDKIMKENENTEFLCVLETNRGCPYKCAYCDWCGDRTMRKFPIEKIKAEIDWIAKNKIEYCFCADSNFGIYRRDEEVVDYIISSNKKCGYPSVFRPCYAKNSDERVFKICSSLDSVGMDKGATLAYQTLNRCALKNIHRENMSMKHYSRLLSRYNKEGIATYSELILGLPGETYESFSQGLCELIEAGQHNSISVYHCELLPNSEMAKSSYIRKHGIKFVKVAFNHMHSAPESGDKIKEYSHLIVQTNTMSKADWVKANLFSICIQCFHHLGLLRCFAIYLYYEKKYSYYDFYNTLLSYILDNPDTSFGRLFSSFSERLTNSLSGDWNYYNEKFGDVVWLFEEGAFLELLSSGEEFWNEILPFLKSKPIEKEVFDELLKYQKVITKKPFDEPFELDLRYDFYSYFRRIYSVDYKSLKKINNTLAVKETYDFGSWEEYARNCVWYGRRLGKTQYTADKNSIEIKYTEDNSGEA